MSKKLNFSFLLWLLAANAIIFISAKKLHKNLNHKFSLNTKSSCEDAETASNSEIANICKRCSATSYQALSLSTWGRDYPKYAGLQTKFSNFFSSADIYVAENSAQYQGCIFMNNALTKSGVDWLSSIEEMFQVKLNSSFVLPSPLTYKQSFVFQSIQVSYSLATSNTFLAGLVLKNNTLVYLSSNDYLSDLSFVYAYGKASLKGSINLKNFYRALSFETQLYNFNRTYWRSAVDQKSDYLSQYIASLASQSNRDPFVDYLNSVCDSFEVVLRSANGQLSIDQGTMKYPKKVYNNKYFKNLFSLNYALPLIDFSTMTSNSGPVFFRDTTNFNIGNTILNGTTSASRLGRNTTSFLESLDSSNLIMSVFPADHSIYNWTGASNITVIKNASISHLLSSSASTLKVTGKISWCNSSNESVDLTLTQNSSSYNSAGLFTLPFGSAALLFESLVPASSMNAVMSNFQADKLYLSCSQSVINFSLINGVKPKGLPENLIGKGIHAFATVTLSANSSKLPIFRQFFAAGTEFGLDLTLASTKFYGSISLPSSFLDLGKNISLQSSKITFQTNSSNASVVDFYYSGTLAYNFFDSSMDFTFASDIKDSKMIISAVSSDLYHIDRLYMTSTSITLRYLDKISYVSGSTFMNFGPRGCYPDRIFNSTNKFCLQGTASLFIDLDDSSNNYFSSRLSPFDWDRLLRAFLGESDAYKNPFTSFITNEFISSSLNWSSGTFQLNYAKKPISTPTIVLPQGFSLNGTITYLNKTASLQITKNEAEGSIDINVFLSSLSFGSFLDLKGSVVDGQLQCKYYFKYYPVEYYLKIYGNATLFLLTKSVQIAYLKSDVYHLWRFSMYGGVFLSNLGATTLVNIKFNSQLAYLSTQADITFNVSSALFKSLNSNITLRVLLALADAKSKIETAYKTYYNATTMLNNIDQDYQSCKNNLTGFCTYLECLVTIDVCTEYEKTKTCTEYGRKCKAWHYICDFAHKGCWKSNCNQWKTYCKKYTTTDGSCLSYEQECSSAVSILNNTCVDACKNIVIPYYNNLDADATSAYQVSQSCNATYGNLYNYAKTYLGSTSKLPFYFVSLDTSQILDDLSPKFEENLTLTYKVKVYESLIERTVNLNLSSLTSIEDSFYDISYKYMNGTLESSA